MSWLLGGNRGALFLAASLEVLSEWESKGLGWLFVYGFAPNQADFQHQATIQSQGKWLFVFKIFGHWEAGGGGGVLQEGLGRLQRMRKSQEENKSLLSTYCIPYIMWAKSIQLVVGFLLPDGAPCSLSITRQKKKCSWSRGGGRGKRRRGKRKKKDECERALNICQWLFEVHSVWSEGNPKKDWKLGTARLIFQFLGHAGSSLPSREETRFWKLFGKFSAECSSCPETLLCNRKISPKIW